MKDKFIEFIDFIEDFMGTSNYTPKDFIKKIKPLVRECNRAKLVKRNFYRKLKQSFELNDFDMAMKLCNKLREIIL